MGIQLAGRHEGRAMGQEVSRDLRALDNTTQKLLPNLPVEHLPMVVAISVFVGGFRAGATGARESCRDNNRRKLRKLHNPWIARIL